VPDALIGDDAIDVRGVAISGGGKGIVRVDVSPDGGRTWQTAELIPNGQDYNKYDD
jgi:sulfite oxidase